MHNSKVGLKKLKCSSDLTEIFIFYTTKSCLDERHHFGAVEAVASSEFLVLRGNSSTQLAVWYKNYSLFANTTKYKYMFYILRYIQQKRARQKRSIYYHKTC